MGHPNNDPPHHRESNLDYYYPDKFHSNPNISDPGPKLEYNIYYTHHQNNIQQHKNHFHKNIVENSGRCRLLWYSSNRGLAHNIFGSLIRRRVLKGSSRCRSLSRFGRLRLRRCIGSQKRRSIWLEPGRVREIWGNFLVWSFLCVAHVIVL